MQLSTPAPDRALRFAADLEAIWPTGERSAPLGLAVSGGADSLALLLLAHAAMPGQIAAASVDHGLRAEAAGEVALVERIARERGIPFASLKVSLGPGNLQARAREARYAALAGWAKAQGIGAIATAHHADDQAETLLMRLNRGSGLAGLAGVRPRGTFAEAILLRPLLGWRKADLRAIVADAGIVAAEDPSNTNHDFERVRIRARLAEADWLDPAQIAASAAHLAESWQAIEWFADCDWHEMVMRDEDAPGGVGFAYCANVPRIVGIETILRIVTALGGHATRAEAGRVWDRLWRGENASVGGVIGRPGIETVAKMKVPMRVWRFRPEPPRNVN